ncbi:MAG TPA: hypothetical protein VKB49_11915 [Candidatus Sulfotelmatobacter sp.]|nr:hypothetical protein [Candidatus Sulfotelmatobacter sp.]
MYRAVLLVFLSLSAIAAPAQSASELKARYGDPEVERFLVRPGVKLMARYASDRTACEILIGPMRSIIPRNEAAIYIRPEVMTEIIEEVLPEANRGNLLESFLTKSGCNEIETKEYENVTITRFRHKCDLPNPEIEGQAMIMRRSPSCAAPSDKLSDATRP